MRLLKSNVILRLLNSYLVDSPQPANISYMWNFGSLLGACLIIQILTGVFLAMHYTPNVEMAFSSVEHIMRDVNAGWILRYTHANVASFFFIFVYFHIARGLYYSSYREPRGLVWVIGVIIFILMMAIGFLGCNHSPKWSKLNKYKNSTLYEKLVKRQNATNFKNNTIQFKTSLGLRHNSTSTFSINYDKSSSLNSEKDSDLTLDKIGNSQILTEFLTEKKLNPVYCYDNLHLDSTIKKIQTETKNLSGVYLILNKVTLDYYIGSAATNRFYVRFSNHLLYFRGSKIVKLAVKKYKLNQFAFLILELFPEVVNRSNNKRLFDLEDFYLKSLLPNYNILTEAGSSFGYKHTEISRLKMKAIYSQERRNKIGLLNRGKNLSKDIIDKIRDKALIREKPNYSEQALLDMKKKSKPVILYNLDSTVYGEFSSIIEAAKSAGCSEKTIRRALKTDKQILKRRWIVKYL